MPGLCHLFALAVPLNILPLGSRPRSPYRSIQRLNENPLARLTVRLETLSCHLPRRAGIDCGGQVLSALAPIPGRHPMGPATHRRVLRGDDLASRGISSGPGTFLAPFPRFLLLSFHCLSPPPTVYSLRARAAMRLLALVILTPSHEGMEGVNGD